MLFLYEKKRIDLFYAFKKKKLLGTVSCFLLTNMASIFRKIPESYYIFALKFPNILFNNAFSLPLPSLPSEFTDSNFIYKVLFSITKQNRIKLHLFSFNLSTLYPLKTSLN